MKKGKRVPTMSRFLGLEGDLGSKLELSKDFALQIIAQNGNYGEIFERNLGKGSPIGLDRGLNALWKDGGILYAPPMR